MRAVGGGKIAQDAALDLAAFGPDLDRFGDQQIAVALHVDVADETLDALLGARPAPAPRQEQNNATSIRFIDDSLSWKADGGIGRRLGVGLEEVLLVETGSRAISTSGKRLDARC